MIMTLEIGKKVVKYLINFMLWLYFFIKGGVYTPERGFENKKILHVQR